METANKQKNWLEIAIIPITIVVVTSIVTLYLGDQQQINEEERTKADLAVKYTEIFLNNYKNIDDPNIAPMLTTAANTMVELELIGGEEFQSLVAANKNVKAQIEQFDTIISEDKEIFFSEEVKKLGFIEKNSIDDCQIASQDSECLIFKDGYLWEVNDSILNWEEKQGAEKAIAVAIGVKGLYFHILGTNLVKEVSYQNFPTISNDSAELNGEEPTKPPLARLEVPSNIPVDYKVLFTSSSLGQDVEITEYLWTFGDGTTGSGMNVTHQYTNPGKYMITLVVVDENGNSSSASEIVNVISEDQEERVEFSKNLPYVTIPQGTSIFGCEEMNECYIPYSIEIRVGDTVSWNNEDIAAHTVTAGNPADGPSGVFDSSLFMPGISFEFTFNEAGIYDYFCMVHPWMQGIVIVE